MYCGCGTTYGDDFRSCRHLWWCSSDCMAVALNLSLLAVRRPYGAGISPPMARKFDSSITHGDGFRFRRHLWRYSSDRMAAAPRLSLLAVRSTRTTGISPPMEMNFDCSFTHGGGLGFRRHLWRYPSDGIAEAPRLSLPAIHGTHATGTSPPMARNSDSGFTHGDGFGFRRHLWRYSSDRMAAAPRLSLLAVRSTRTTGISPPMEMNFDCGFTHGGGLGFRRHLWRSPADGIAEAPRLSLPAIHGTHATGTSPPMARNSDSGFTHGDGFGSRRHLWRYSSDPLPPRGVYRS